MSHSTESAQSEVDFLRSALEREKILRQQAEREAAQWRAAVIVERQVNLIASGMKIQHALHHATMAVQAQEDHWRYERLAAGGSDG